MKRKTLNVVIPVDIYCHKVMFSFNEKDDSLRKNLSKHDIGWHDNIASDGPCPWYGKTWRAEGVGFILVRLMSYPVNCGEYGVLQHEIFHAVDMIMRLIQIRLSDDSDEAYAYLIEYLTKKIYEEM